MLSSKKIRRAIKNSPFNFIDIAMVLGIGERTLYHKLEHDGLNIRELNILLKILNLNITDFENKE